MTTIIDTSARPIVAPTIPHVRIITDFGDLLVELYPDRAPISVAAFLGEVRAGSYTGGSFSRVVRSDNDRGSPVIEVIQGGVCREMEPLANVSLESTTDTSLRHEDGTISLPRVDGGPGSAQGFFICIGAQPALDAGGGRTRDELGFAAFGRVVEGMNVARAIHGLPTRDDAPTEYLEGQIPFEPLAIHGIVVEAETPAGLLTQLADEFWAFRLREFPEEASAAGVRSGNPLLEEVSDKAHARRARVCEAMLIRARAIESTGLDVEEGTTLALLISALATIVEAYRLDEHHRPRLYPFGFFSLPNMLVAQTSLDTIADRADFLARLERMPNYMAASMALLRRGFAKGFRLPAYWCRASLRCLIAIWPRTDFRRVSAHVSRSRYRARMPTCSTNSAIVPHSL